ncbi:right-handed parallel beta-helix repeat-containing protein, partial [bacterium]|nr:right-handed parallel beta-helix repeat-containing protein [bacterium]
MKTMKFVIPLMMVVLVQFASAQTTVPGGYVSGTWNASGSPYLIDGEITVHSDSALTIGYGVDVIFQGHYKLIVNGLLEANGTEQDSILFTAADTSIGWHGIKFVSASDSSLLKYCQIVYAKGNSPFEGGGIYCDNSSPTIKNCLIENCYAHEGGGICGYYNSSPLIEGNSFISDSASVSGGAMYFYFECFPT